MRDDQRIAASHSQGAGQNAMIRGSSFDERPERVLFGRAGRREWVPEINPTD